MGRLIEDSLPGRRASRINVVDAAHTDYVAHVVSATSPPGTKGDIVNAAVADLLRASDVSAVLSAAVRSASQLLSTHIAFVMLLDGAAKVLKLEASVGHRTPTFTTIVRPVRAFTVVGTGRPVQSSDFLNDSRLDHDPATDDIIRKEGIRTVLAVPLHARGKMLGALYVGHRQPRHFSAAE